MTRIQPLLALFSLLITFSTPLTGQDIHVSQFQNAPQLLNPALAGSFEGGQRFGASYRNQWVSVPVPYESLSAAYDQKLFLPWLGANWLGLGGGLLYDQAGDGGLSWMQLSLAGAFHLELSEAHSLSAGLQLRAGQRALEPGQFQFGDQFADNAFDPNYPTAEAFAKTSAGFFSLGAGVNWAFLPGDSRTRAWAGISVAHLNRPSITFLNDGKVPLPMLLNAHFLGIAQFSPQMDAVLNLLLQRQGPYQENLANFGIRYHLSEEKGKELALQLGGGYRFDDAAIAYIDVFFRNWHAGFSYDFNTSPFQAATNKNGGPELSVSCIISHVKPPKVFKACPIF